MRRGSVPIDFIVTNRVTVLTAAIAGVTLDSVDEAILHLLHDTNMVGRTILAAIIPIEKDNVARARLIAVVLLQSALLEPRHTLRGTGRKLRNDASFNIDRNHTEGRHTVNQNRVIVLLNFIDIGSQRELPAHGVYQAHFHKSTNLDWLHLCFIAVDKIFLRLV